MCNNCSGAIEENDIFVKITDARSEFRGHRGELSSVLQLRLNYLKC